ncbi:DEAD/DEAH box helicase [Salsipaludibacter albus]|uniref:DEAD/DEAH box helicase n=1 Tax=Salsipaludibacter albus TaxID=2849650 RepID=UPI001EE4DF9C|nr:DEAD/DEAH box helicase [Salsipaludibacter albus]MBY5163552.1 DEAD/DEAH box helicase [Salsipaludibacter albus]
MSGEELADVLDGFSRPVAEWFATTFATPTPAQQAAWPAIRDGQSTLLLAPTGSGKTLAAFLAAIDALMTADEPPTSTQVVYLSPLRALAVDIDRNLRAPLTGIELAAQRLETQVRVPTVGIRTGDTSSRDRARLIRTPPDILITTPESLYLYLTSRGRETLADVRTVIVDEIHAMAPTKRGTHLALTLERLDAVVRRAGNDPPQRLALSATQRPLDEIATFLGGVDIGPDDSARPRPVTVVDAGDRPNIDLEVVVPVDDLSAPVAPDATDLDPAEATTASIWPAMHPRLVDLVTAHTSTIVFVNARRLAERLAADVNDVHARRVRRSRLEDVGLPTDRLDPFDPDLADGVHQVLTSDVEPLVRAHHGSLSKANRRDLEDALKEGRIRGLVATSSLELGIDMGAVDLVVQVASPGSVASGLQRVGRAGHQVGETSRGVIFPKFRHDLLEATVVAERMLAGDVEPLRYPRNPLDVLAQQVVAMVAMDDVPVDELYDLVRGAAPYAELGRDVFLAVLDLLAGRYPSDEFSELRPRIVWDRVDGVLRARANSQQLAVVNAGTIPDRGLYRVVLGDNTRVGELDEEMVHESRVGDRFVLGASTWRIDDITHDRVVVSPAPGRPGKLPFWHGDGPGRSVQLGRAMGRLARELSSQDRDDALARLRTEHGLDERAATNLVTYLAEQAAATGQVPDDRTIVVERFRDELGDWRIVVHASLGAPVLAPWAMAIEARMVEQGLEPEVLWTDDGIVLRLQEAHDEVDADLLALDPADVQDLLRSRLVTTSRFTTSFREAAGRALLLPRRRPGQRTALWLQRQRAANLLQVALGHPTFPILLEATREVLQDVFDLPALTEVLEDLRTRKLKVRVVDTASPSPWAQSLLFSWVGQWMYDYDAPAAERRAAALALDPDLLAELLGDTELRELLDPEVVAVVAAELQHLEPIDPRGRDRRLRDADGIADLVADLGPLTLEELADRVRDPDRVRDHLDDLVATRRVIEVGMAGESRWAAAEDAARLRDGLGVALPPGLPSAFTDPVPAPLVALVARHARTHTPFTAAEAANRLGTTADRVTGALRALEADDRITQGAFRPGGGDLEWADIEVVRQLKRRSLAALRNEIEPVDQAAFARFLVDWHGVVDPQMGIEALLDAIEVLEGVSLAASTLESQVLAARVAGDATGLLDQALATGEVAWRGVESVGRRDGRLALAFRDHLDLLPEPLGDPPSGEVHDRLRVHLAGSVTAFWPDLYDAAGGGAVEDVLDALWDLVWAGEVVNDSFAAVRARTAGGGGGRRRRRRPGRLRRGGPPAAQGRWTATDLLSGPEVSDADPDEDRDDAGPDVPTTPDAEAVTRRQHAVAGALLERQGVVTGDGVRSEGIPGAWAGIYPILSGMEATGTVRRGYFVAGLGAAQFALPGVVDRLRAQRESSTGTVVLAATDPAQPWGAILDWPATDGRPSRSVGGLVVLGDGQPRVLLERGGRSLVTFPTATEPDWVQPLLARVDALGGRVRLQRIDGIEAADHPIGQWLQEHGFVVTPGGLVARETAHWGA